MARSVNSDEQHACTARRRPSRPTTLRNVSAAPANDASGKSSAVADDRTASSGSRPSRAHSRSYAATIATFSSSGRGVSRTAVRAARPCRANSGRFSGSNRSKMARSFASRPSVARSRRYASAVVANPSSTPTPFGLSARNSSPSEAFLPPTRPRSVRAMSEKSRTSFRTNDLHRARRVAHDALRDAAQQKSVHALSSVGSEHDHVRTPFRGDVQDRAPRIALTNGRTGVESSGPQLLSGTRHQLLALTASLVAHIQDVGRGGRPFGKRQRR